MNVATSKQARVAGDSETLSAECPSVARYAGSQSRTTRCYPRLRGLALGYTLLPTPWAPPTEWVDRSYSTFPRVPCQRHSIQGFFLTRCGRFFGDIFLPIALAFDFTAPNLCDNLLWTSFAFGAASSILSLMRGNLLLSQ